MLAPGDLSLRSMEQQVAEMDPEAQAKALAGIEIATLRWSWNWTARPDQLAATSDLAHVIMMLAGRGAGKTRTAGEFVRKRTGKGKKVRFALVGRTAADVRDVIVQGESGILSVFPPSERPRYIPSARRVEFVDGSMALCYSAEEPSQLRGPQFHYAVADELAAWDLRPDDSGLNAFDNLQFATRLGDRPQIFVATTPKRVKLIRALVKEAAEGDRVSLYNVASTYDNVHLSKAFIDVITGIYGGTRLASQEIHGHLGDDVEGALWVEELLDEIRTYEDPGRLPLRVIGVDPTVSETPNDECGIIAVGATNDAKVTNRRAWVLGDYTVQGPPKIWIPKVCEAARLHDAVVHAEANQGGVLVKDSIQTHDPGIKVVLVHAKIGKELRAEPVAMAYDQRRVFHFRRFAELEDQLTTWVPGDPDSPDRMDALVHGLTGLVTLGRDKVVGTATTTNPARKGVTIATGADIATSRR